MTNETVAPSPSSPSRSAARAGSQSAGSSTGSSITSNPQSRTRGASVASRSSVSGDVHTQVLTPIGRATLVILSGLPVLPGLGEAGQVLAAELGVVERRHV